MYNISTEIGRKSRSVQTLNQKLQAFLEKFSGIGRVNCTEKQQKLLLGLEFLSRSERRLTTLQRFQIEPVEKRTSMRSRLAQIEIDLRPENIERTVGFVGSVHTDELRDERRRNVLAEQYSVQALLSKIQSNLNDTNQQVKETQEIVQRLGRALLFEVEKETSAL